MEADSNYDDKKKYEKRVKAFLCASDQSELSQDDIHYVLAFKNFKYGSCFSWNWAAFFLYSFNFAYRKNWIAFVISLFAQGIALRIVLTLFADYLYHKKFQDTCTKADLLSSSEEVQMRFIAQKGGKNLGLAILLGLLPLIIIAGFVAVFMGALVFSTLFA